MNLEPKKLAFIYKMYHTSLSKYNEKPLHFCAKFVNVGYRGIVLTKQWHGRRWKGWGIKKSGKTEKSNLWMPLIFLLSDGGCGILGHYVNSDECIEKFGIARDVMHFQQLSRKIKPLIRFSAKLFLSSFLSPSSLARASISAFLYFLFV